MSILELHGVSIRYITGDFKDIGLKEYVIRKLKRDYHVREFWADKVHVAQGDFRDYGTHKGMGAQGGEYCGVAGIGQWL